MESTEVADPENEPPSVSGVVPRRHWYSSVGVPLDPMLKSASAPAVTVASAGCKVIDGESLAITGAVAHAALTCPLERFRARARYVVLLTGLTISVVPLPTSVPPQLPVNQ